MVFKPFFIYQNRKKHTRNDFMFEVTKLYINIFVSRFVNGILLHVIQ